MSQQVSCINHVVATVWKSKQSMDPLGQRLFRERTCVLKLRSTTSNETPQPVPGYPKLASNLMARIWNDIPELQNATTLSAARVISKKWAKGVPR